MGNNPILHHLFVVKSIPVLAWGALKAAVSLGKTTIIVGGFEYFLSFWHYKMFQAHLVYFLPIVPIVLESAISLKIHGSSDFWTLWEKAREG